MTEQEKALDNHIPYERHPLYQEITEQLAGGDEAGAVANLERLAELYPEEQFIQDMLLRFRLRTTFEETEHIPVEHRRPTPILRLVMISLLLISACLVLAVVVLISSRANEGPENDPQATVTQALAEVDQRLSKGDVSGAREALEPVATLVPDDPVVQEKRQLIDRYQAEADLLNSAHVAKDADDYVRALDLASQIPPDSSYYDRAQQLIAELQEPIALEEIWLEAERLLAAEDWQAAIPKLEELRTRNPDYRRSQVEGQLYRVWALLATQQLEQAGGNLDAMRQAIVYLQEALRYRPTDQPLDEERRLAIRFVAGGEAFERGEWAKAASRWEPVYDARSDYQDGILEENLFDAYPLAAKDLIARANGSVKMLTEAIGYLDRTPGDEALREERLLVEEFLNGLEAFAQEKWDLAIAHWGPIYALRPNYQNGLLEENLRLACASSSAPDEGMCPP